MKKNHSFTRVTFLAITLLLVSMTASAQNWNDMVRWMKNSGKYKLAELAHPIDYANDKVLGYQVEATSSCITVKVRYEGFMGEYSDTYEIVKGAHRDRPFFRRIRVSEPWDPFCTAFQSIENFGLSYENDYLRSDFRSYYGEDYRDLSKGEKAAYALYTFFESDFRTAPETHQLDLSSLFQR